MPGAERKGQHHDQAEEQLAHPLVGLEKLDEAAIPATWLRVFAGSSHGRRARVAPPPSLSATLWSPCCDGRPGVKPLHTSWRRGEFLLLACVLLAGLALRLAILEAYEPSIDLGVRLNWARRIATAQSIGPVQEIAQRLAAGEIGAVRELLGSRQDSLLFAVASNLYAYIPDVMRLGSALAMALWNRAFGWELATSRLLSILVDLAGVAVLAACSARLTGSRRAALIGAAVLALLPAKVLLSVQSYYHVFGGPAALVALWSFVASPAFAPSAASGGRPWTGVTRTGPAFGASMYFDWFQPQLAWVAALAYTVWAGSHSRDLGPIA